MEPTQEQIDAFYKELFNTPEFLAELERISAELVHKHLVLGEPFPASNLGWDDELNEWNGST